ncbi:general substrate transporter [Trichoderma sp. SZMC 28012]
MAEKTDLQREETRPDSIHDLKHGGATAEAIEAIRAEHELTFGEALKLYPKAIAWSGFVSIGVIMLAFDPQLIGNLYSTPQFARDFGHLYKGDVSLTVSSFSWNSIANGHVQWVIEASWQTALSMGNPIGQVLGALFAAYPMDYFGRKLTFAACVILTAGIVFIQFFSKTLGVLLAGELLAGLVLGMFVVIAPAYASEVCPTALRGHLTSFVNLCFVIGQLLGNGVTAGTSKLENHWAYKIPFLLQWFWILVILPGMAFIPESPWWLVRKNRLEDAEKSLRRLASPKVNVQATLAFIVETDRLEQELEAGSTYWDCFKGDNWRRTEISMGVYCTQVLSGIYLINYGTFFFQQAGLPTDRAFDMSVGFLAVGFVGTLVSWGLMLKFGRRTLFVSGLAWLVVLQFVIGILDCIPGRPSGAIWAESSLMLIWNFFYDISIGPVCFVLLGECSATRVRSKTIAAATAAQGLLGIVMTVAIPYMINPEQANLQGKLGFFFGGLALICLIWSYFRVPETMGRTFEELDLLFDKKVPARQFKGYKLEGAVSAGAA